MKRVLAALGVMTLIGFIVGKLTGRHQPIAESSSASSPTVHVQVAPPEEKPLEGRLQPFRRWLDRYRDILDPAFVLTIATAAAVATGYFAWQTNAINNDQRKLMERQVSIQASQSLPIFNLSLAHSFDQEGQAVSEYLNVTNTGGMARSIDIDARAGVEVQWSGFDNECGDYWTGNGLSRIELPLTDFTDLDYIEQDEWGNFYAIPESLPENLNNGESLTLGNNSNLWNLNNALTLIESRMLYDYGYAYDFRSVLWYVRITYDDYQGVSRSEYYVAESAYHHWYYSGSIARNPDELKLYKTYGIGRDQGESWYKTADEMVDSGLYIKNGRYWDEEHEERFFPHLKSEMTDRVDAQTEHYPSDWPFSELEACRTHPMPTPTPDS